MGLSDLKIEEAISSQAVTITNQTRGFREESTQLRTGNWVDSARLTRAKNEMLLPLFLLTSSTIHDPRLGHAIH